MLAALVLVLGVVGCDESTNDPATDSALIRAAEAGDLERVESLVADGADVAAVDERGRTALISAAYGNHVDVARALLEAGADVNAQDTSQQSAFLIATSEVGPDPALLELTLEHGADHNAHDSYNGTSLIRAAHRGYVPIVQRLLETDVDLDHVNRLGWTALLEAVILGDGGPAHTRVVRLLLEAGADHTIPDGNGVTALEHARAAGQTAVVALLEKAGNGP